MSKVRSKDTKPELVARSLVHRLGFRFRLHRADLPGKPDIVLPRHRRVIFIHGCFWHQHPGCGRASRPATRRGFWNAKLDGNTDRDRKAVRKLKRLGWRVLILWECQTRDPRVMLNRIVKFLESAP